MTLIWSKMIVLVVVVVAPLSAIFFSSVFGVIIVRGMILEILISYILLALHILYTTALK